MPGELGCDCLHCRGVTGVAQPVQRGTARARLELQPDLEGCGDRTRRPDRQRTHLSAFGERDGALVDARDPGDVSLPKSASTASETEQPTDCEVVHGSIMARRHYLAVTSSCTADARTHGPDAGQSATSAPPRTHGPDAAAGRDDAPGPRISPPSTTPRACRSRAASGRDPISRQEWPGARRERSRRRMPSSSGGRAAPAARSAGS